MLDFFSPKLLGSISAGIGIVSGLSSLFGGGDSGGATQPGQASVADPFAAQRPQYQQQLSQLMASPGAFASSPEYQFAFGQGMEGVNRTAAARGMLGSGNRLYDLTKFGQGLAGQQYFQQAGLLAQLAGANIGSPAAAGQLGQQQQQAGWSALGQGMGGLANVAGTSGSMLNAWFGGGSSGADVLGGLL